MADAPSHPSSSLKQQMEMGPNTTNAKMPAPSASPSPSQPYKAPTSSTAQPIPPTTTKCGEMIYDINAAVKEVSFVGNDLQMISVVSLIIFVTYYHQQHPCMH